MKFIKCIIFISCHNKVVYYVEFVSCKLKIRKKKQNRCILFMWNGYQQQQKSKSEKVVCGFKTMNYEHLRFRNWVLEPQLCSFPYPIWLYIIFGYNIIRQKLPVSGFKPKFILRLKKIIEWKKLKVVLKDVVSKMLKKWSKCSTLYGKQNAD